jgi:amino acid adenylation domain-containing protein
MSYRENYNPSGGVAVIGLAGRFPGAINVDEFWRNLVGGVESIAHFADAELEFSPVDDAKLAEHPNYVKARGIIEDADHFDAAFFGINPREAETMDPQQRIFLETAWQALEQAGYDAGTFNLLIGVFAAMSNNSYLPFLRRAGLAGGPGSLQAMFGNEKDYLATRVSYHLGLRGPSINVQTACSSSLVAVCQAFQSLLSYQCDMALAGGVSVVSPQKSGYLHYEGAITSPDGQCRPFDAAAQGTVFSNGAGVVVLKRLQDAIDNGDQIYAVIKGAAVNNDGSDRVSFAAPNVNGQAEAIAMAQALAGIDPETISYIEAHGTGTALGDPIEIAGLTQAFRLGTAKNGFCALGSVKSNIGHLDVAAGVAGLIKTVLALRHGKIPPSLHYKTPNPEIDFSASPFFVNRRLSDWEAADTPRRAGVSSFGSGGTNAHVVLEQAPAQPPSMPPRSAELIVLSAKTGAALDQATKNLADYLSDHPELNLGDVAHTLQSGRRCFDHRRMVVCRDLADGAQALRALSSKRVVTRHEQSARPVAFMFPGQGSQQVDMGRGLYDESAFFRDQIAECADILADQMGIDIRTILYPEPARRERAEQLMAEPLIAQSALFVFEYSLAKLWMHWGIEPNAVIGHSLGEYAAACMAGVLSLDDALKLIVERARLLQTLPGGAMLAVRLPCSQVERYLSSELTTAAINAPKMTVVSGSQEAVRALENELAAKKIASRRLVTSHAFHSAMLDPILQPFREAARGARLNEPGLRWVSTLTGAPVTAAQATDPEYWVRQLREPVRFADGVGSLLAGENCALLEVGPGQGLSTFARQHPNKHPDQEILPSLAAEQDPSGDFARMLDSLGRLWLAGAPVHWARGHEQPRRRTALPTYPFEHKRFWIAGSQPGGRKRIRVEESEAVMNAPVSVRLREEIAGTSARETGQAASSEAAHDHREMIKTKLRSLFCDISGLPAAELLPDASFLELGLDSLLLTQASAAVQKEFGVKISFRQLLEEISSLEALAEHIAPLIPPSGLGGKRSAPSMFDKSNGNSLAASGRGSRAPSKESLTDRVEPAQPGGDASVMERIFARQLDLMQQQIDMLKATGRAHDPDNATDGGATAAGISLASVAPPAVAKGEIAPNAKSTPAIPAREKSSDEKGFGPYKPVQKAMRLGLSEVQKRGLDDLIAHYTKRTSKSKKLTAEHRAHLADPRTVSGFRSVWKELVYPIVTERSAGSRLWDVDDNEYIDLTNGFGAILFGHGPEFVAAAIHEQVDQGIEIGPQSPLAGEVAQLLCELTGMERAAFCNTGSEAVLAALRIARTVTGRDKIAMFAGDYHGIFDEVVVRAAGGVSSRPAAPGIPASMADNVMVLDYGNPASLDIIRAHADRLAAVIVEPVQSRRLDLQPKEFLQELRRLTAAHGSALIFDEIVTGFRAHLGGAQALFGVRADIATYGKVIGGGLPIGVVAGKAQYMDALDGGKWQFGDDSAPEAAMTFFAGTFMRHPLALAASKACLIHLKENSPALQEQLNRRTEDLVHRLRARAEAIGAPVRITHFSSLFAFEFPPELPLAPLLYPFMRARGIHVWEGRLGILTTAHTDQDIDRVVEAFAQSLAEMQQAEFLPGCKTAPVERGSGDRVEDENDGADQVIPVTEGQREIWLAARLSDDASQAFTDCVTLELRGPLQTAALGRAVEKLVARHDALRMTFSPDGETLVVRRRAALAVQLFDLQVADPTEKFERLAQLIADQRNKPFDLSAERMARCAVAQLASEHHVVILTTHHAAVDGWSLGVLIAELGELYSAECRGEATEPIPAAQFAEYARREAAEQGSDTSKVIEKFWIDRFTTLPAPLNLPGERRRNHTETYRARRSCAVLAPNHSQELRRFAARQGSTLFSLLLAAFQVLLYRLSGQDDIVVGIPMAGQMASESPDLVGHCVNFLPLRQHMDGAQKFSAYLAAVKKSVLEAQEHQGYTYGSLLRRLKVVREGGRAPLISATFNLDRANEKPRFHGLDAELEVQERPALNFDCEMNVVEGKEGISINWQYKADLFDAETISRWVAHYQTLLAGIVADPERAISKLPLLTGEERRELLMGREGEMPDFPPDHCLHELFTEQARRTPEAVAVSFGNQRLTYRELDRKADLLAHRLQERGVGPEDLVGLCVERSPELIVGILGILKAGGAYLPLDPSYPKERLAFMVDDARVSFLLTQKSLTSCLPEHQATVIYFDRDSEMTREELLPTENTIACGKPDNLAYVIYTSGSTGKPKGALITHRNVTRLFSSTEAWFGFGADDVWTLFHSYAFDFSVWEMWGALLCGGRLVIVPQEVSRSPKEFASLIARERVTVLNQTPSAFRQLLPYLTDSMDPGALSLRYVIFGGEALDLQMLKPWFDRQSDRTPRIVNMYGITETTVHVTYKPIIEADLDAPSGSVIGRPIPDLKLYLLDSHLEPVPRGVAGEIYVGGAGVARGYLHRPELTKERFIADPFSADPQARLYRAGDLARRLSNDELEYLGRIDQQVKIRGFRIEPCEIEACLGACPGIRSTVVVAREDKDGEKRLIAYIEADADGQPTVRELISFMRRSLPEYMVPSAFVFLDSFPLTHNGKVDYRALPDPNHKYSDQHEYAAPRNETERVLCQVWSEVLGVERVGIDDDFFTLGGHSLLAAKVFRRLDEKFGHSLPLAVLFTAPTVRLLAEHYRVSVESNKNPVVVPLRASGTLPPLFAVPGIFGNVVGFADLARELGSQQPVYGLQSRGLDGDATPLDSIEEMARTYAAEIRSVQPYGPYALVGACFGATVAYEMARQMLADGEPVAFLGLLDPTEQEGSRSDRGYYKMPAGVTWAAALSSMIARRLQLYAREARGLTRRQWLNFVACKFRNVSAALSDQKRMCGVGRELNQIKVYQANLRALDRYRRQPLYGSLSSLEIFQTTTYETDLLPFRIDWSRFWTGPIKFHEMPGKDSGDMASGDNARVLAASLGQRLRLAFQAAKRRDGRPYETAQCSRNGLAGEMAAVPPPTLSDRTYKISPKLFGIIGTCLHMVTGR